MLKALETADTTEEAFSANVVALAAKGNTTALSLIAERLWTKPRATLEALPVEFDPDSTLAQKAAAILDAALAGDISPDHAHALTAAVAKVIEVAEYPGLVERIRALEQGR
jgi:hypothetical protein